jgi:hypothetical protein
MSIIPSHHIVAILSTLACSDIPYRLLRNIGNELPDRLKKGKDIDILIHWDDKEKVDRFLKQNSFQKVSHPLRKDKFLYGVHPFQFYKHTSVNVFIDCHFELACRSLNQGEWIPLDHRIQQQAWSECSPHRLGGIVVAGLPHVCECLHILTRCVFDKRYFNDNYIGRIEELAEILSDPELLEVFQPVFFRFSGTLLQLIRAKRYDEIISAHLGFMEY